MVKVDQQPFPPIKETKAKDVVIDKSRSGSQDDVHRAEAPIALVDNHLRAEQGVSVHVVDVGRKGRVSVVE